MEIDKGQKNEVDVKIIKPSGLIQITNKKISLLQRKAFNILIFNAYTNIEEEYQAIELNQLKKYLEYHDLKTLKNELINLMGIVVEFNIIGNRDKTKWQAYALLPFVEIDEDQNTIRYSFGPFRNKLKEPAFYARLNLEIQKHFKSRYTLALYEFCCDNFIRQRGFGVTPWIPLEELKELLGYDGNIEFKFFKRNVLNRALKEINEKSDIRVSMKLRRKNKAVSSIQFLVYPDEKNQFLKKLFGPKQQELFEGEGSELYYRLIHEFSVNELLARDILKRFSREHIENTLFYISKRKERIKDLGAYTYSMITNEKIKILTPGINENRTQIDIPDGATVEINGKKYKYEDGFVKIDKMHSIPEAKLKQMIAEGKAKIYQS